MPEPVLSRFTPDPYLLQTFLPFPRVFRHQGLSPLGRTYPYSRPESLEFTTFSRTLPFTRTVSRSRASCHPPLQSEKVCPSLESIQTRCMLSSTVSPRVDFVQDLYLKELGVNKPAPKVPLASSPVPKPQRCNTHSHPVPLLSRE